MEEKNNCEDSFTTKAVSGVSEYLEYIESLKPQGIVLFRGQKDDYELLPKLGRNRVKIGSNESSMFPDLDGLSRYIEWKNEQT